MLEVSSREVSIPVAKIAAVEQYRLDLVSQIRTTRRALNALDREASGDALESFLEIIQGQLKQIELQATEQLAELPNWILRYNIGTANG